ncbi:MAG TPA: hypothetical protein DEO73_13400 [Pantoea sp.]|nr:hypothetical protein [Pantoea sp.]
MCSPQSLTHVSSRGFTHLPPSCNSNYLGYMIAIDLTDYHPRVQQRALSDKRSAQISNCSGRFTLWITSLTA